MKSSLFWPCTTLALLVILNAVVNPAFLSIAWRDGHFYGNLIDILNRTAPLALVSTGMTLVIAARGLDISVGAVVAIAAATAAVLIGGSLNLGGGESASEHPPWLAVVAALRHPLVCGVWEGAPGGGGRVQPHHPALLPIVAGRRHAQPL